MVLSPKITGTPKSRNNNALPFRKGRVNIVSMTKTKQHTTNAISGTPKNMALRFNALNAGYTVWMSCPYSSIIIPRI